MTTPTDWLKVIVCAKVTRRGLTRKRVLDGRIGSVFASASTKPDLEADLSRQLKALALYPQPLYRRLCDGRGLIARITGASAEGMLCYALERYHPDGRTAGSEHGNFYGDARAATDRVGVASLDSQPEQVEAALRRLIEHEVRRFEECSQPVREDGAQ